MEKIDLLDKKILGILSKNARIPFKDVAAQCNVSRAAIHQRVQHLIEEVWDTPHAHTWASTWRGAACIALW